MGFRPMFLDLDFHECCAFGRVTLRLQGGPQGSERLCFGQPSMSEGSGDGGAGASSETGYVSKTQVGR